MKEVNTFQVGDIVCHRWYGLCRVLNISKPENYVHLIVKVGFCDAWIYALETRHATKEEKIQFTLRQMM